MGHGGRGRVAGEAATVAAAVGICAIRFMMFDLKRFSVIGSLRLGRWPDGLAPIGAKYW
jgi:hypothetical protein